MRGDAMVAAFMVEGGMGVVADPVIMSVGAMGEAAVYNRISVIGVLCCGVAWHV